MHISIYDKEIVYAFKPIMLVFYSVSFYNITVLHYMING